MTGTSLTGLRLREKWLGYARSLVDGVSLRTAAAQNDIHLETSFRRRHRFLASAKSKMAGAGAAHGERVIGCYHIQNINASVSRFDLCRSRF